MLRAAHRALAAPLTSVAGALLLLVLFMLPLLPLLPLPLLPLLPSPPPPLTLELRHDDAVAVQAWPRVWLEPLLHLGASVSLPADAVRALQTTLDCWLDADKGAWVAASDGSTGWLYPRGGHLGPANHGADALRWVPAEACGAGGRRQWPVGAWAQPWNATRAGALLARFGGVFFLGDSLSQQAYFSLASAFADGFADERAVPMQLGPSALGGAARGVPVVFANRPNARWTAGDAAEGTLAAAGARYTLVLNRGAHFAPDDVFARELNHTLHALRELVPNTLTVWRATVPGSYRCGTDHGGGRAPTYASLADALHNVSAWPYDWDKMLGQNALARALIREHHPHVLVLDPAGPSLLRPGARFSAHESVDDDCLHWAMPGPPDFWTVALIELLALVEQYTALLPA